MTFKRAAFHALTLGVILGCTPHAFPGETSVPEGQLIALVEGCWTTDSSRVVTVTLCFESKGDLALLSYNSDYKEILGGSGRYQVHGDRLRLSLQGSSDAWPYYWSHVSCEVLVEPGAELSLSRCSGDGEPIGKLVGERAAPPVEDTLWLYSGSVASCDYCTWPDDEPE